jgi:molybdopterin-guanine dinucleotide biosynthesis protein A
MGVDKALLLDAQGRSMLSRACSVLTPLAEEVWLACGTERRYEELGRELVLDQRSDGGPLAGLEAALERATSRWILALACDMPHATSDVLATLLDKALADDLDACWLSTPAGPEPLCAVYSVHCLEAVRAALETGERRMIAFHTYPVRGRALRLAGLDLSTAHLAANLNTPADWEAFRTSTR